MRLGLFVLFAMCASLAVHAGDVYKWVDKNGNVHYGDKPRQSAEQVEVKPGSGTGQPANPDAAKAEAERAAQCERMKAKVKTYKDASTVKETDALGHTRDYSEQERQQLIAQTEKKAAEACAPPKAAP
jgi:hypothetical protein